MNLGLRIVVIDSSGILFCPNKAKKIQRIARPEGNAQIHQNKVLAQKVGIQILSPQ